MLRREKVMDVAFYQRQGLSQRGIAERLGIHRKTVKRSLENRGEYKPYDTSNRHALLVPHRDRILAWLEEDDYSGSWMHDRLVAQGYTGSLRTLQRFLRREGKKLLRKAFLPFETEPGRQAQVDFGEFALLDGEGRKVGRVYLFLMVLGYSRKKYAEILLRPDLTSFLDAHRRAFEFFGGVPSEILYDCMKNVVIRLGGGEPKWNDTFFSFAGHYGFAPRLCPPYASWVKGKVERPIRFIREGFWRGYRFVALPEANRDLLAWLLGKEQMIHGTTHQTIAERFEGERASLGPLPPTAFDTSDRFFRMVGKDCCVHFGCNRYMLPHRAVGRKVILRVKDGVIRAYDGPELLTAYEIRAGKGHLVAHPHLIEALRKDQEQLRMKYRRPTGGHKGAARTIGLVGTPWQVAVQKRDIGVYTALAGGSHE